jgi:tetratricopeptide (TPR) repeat protein
MGYKFMKKINRLKASILVLPILASCSVDMKKIEEKAALINHYEQVSLKLARENRELQADVKRLEFEVEKLKQEKSYNETKSGGPKIETAEHKVHETEATQGRSIASVAPAAAKDLVEFKIYKWHADDLLKIADKEFKDKNYEKAAQFYTSMVNNYPTNKSLTDEFYFKAGIAAYESGTHHEWTLSHFETLMTKYPTSQYFRSAKLWVALTHMKLGDKKKFYATVEEFRKKYRNTNEWKILSSYYEKIEEKTNE